MRYSEHVLCANSLKCLSREHGRSQRRCLQKRIAMSDNLTNRVQPDRSKINMNEDYEVKYWTHALGVSREALQKAVDKVGNSAAAVRKELGLRDASQS